MTVSWNQLHNGWYMLIISLFGIITFQPVLDAEFVSWDDSVYILDNPIIQGLSLENVERAFATPQVHGTYSPIVLLSWMFDYTVNGLDPFVFHVLNLFLHIINSLLVFSLVHRWTRSKFSSLIVGILFCIHPMHVEPVAWITGRKDLLYTFFLLASLTSYDNYITSRSWPHFLLTVLMFAFSVLSKAVAVVLPVIFILLDLLIYKRTDSRQLWFEKIPLLSISVGMGLLAILAQQKAEAFETTSNSLVFSFVNLSEGVLLYLVKTIFPFQLSPFHPFPKDEVSGVFGVFIPIVLLIGLSIILFAVVRKNRFMIFGLAFFIISILPTLQFVQFGNAIIAERYTYVSYIGLFLILSEIIKGFLGKTHSKMLRALTNLAMVAVLLIFCIASNGYASIWKTSFTLWSHVKNQYPDHYLAYNKLGLEMVKTQRQEDAIPFFSSSIDKNNIFAEAYNNRGMAFMQTNRWAAAQSDFTSAVRLDSTFYLAWMNLGISQNVLLQYSNALESLRKAERLSSSNYLIHYNLGVVLENMKRIDDAESCYTMSIELNRNFADGYFRRAKLRALRFELTQGLMDVNTAIDISQNRGHYYALRSEIKISMNDNSGALEDAFTARNLGFNVSPEYLELILARLNETDQGGIEKP